VLAKLIKLRVRSIKCLGWIGSRESNRSRGLLVVLLRHMKQIKNYRKGQGSKCKPAGLIFFLWTEAADGQGGHWPMAAPAIRVAGGSTAARNRRRRSRGV
jgi:hypothetical protein